MLVGSRRDVAPRGFRVVHNVAVACFAGVLIVAASPLLGAEPATERPESQLQHTAAATGASPKPGKGAAVRVTVSTFDPKRLDPAEFADWEAAPGK